MSEGFDPAAFLAKRGPAPRAEAGFDPGAFLAGTRQGPLASTAPTAREALGRGGLQGATLGFGDEGTGAITSLMQGATNLLPQSARDKLDLVQAPAGDAYTYSRDLERERNKAAEDAPGGDYLAGNIIGTLATAPLLPGLKAAQGAGKAARILTAAANAGGQGLAYGAGSSSAADALGVAKDAGKFGIAGAGLGAAGATAAEVLGGASRAFGRSEARAVQRGEELGAKEAAAKVASARGSLGAQVQQANRLVENLQRLEASGMATPDQVSHLRALRPHLETLNRKLMDAGLRDLPGMAADVEGAQAAYQAIAGAEPAMAGEAAARLLSPGEAARQLGARALRYGLPVAAGAAGGLLGPVGGAIGYFAGGGARPAMHALRRMAQHPSVAKLAATAGERLTGFGADLLGAAAPGVRALEGDAAHLFPLGQPALAEGDQSPEDILKQLAQADALRRRRPEMTP